MHICDKVEVDKFEFENGSMCVIGGFFDNNIGGFDIAVEEKLNGMWFIFGRNDERIVWMWRCFNDGFFNHRKSRFAGDDRLSSVTR